MVQHKIELNNLITKGQVTCEYRDQMLLMTTDRSLPSKRFDAEHLSINSYIMVPEKYKLPIRIDMTVKLDAPGLYVLLGNGHVNIGTLCSDNRRLDDIAIPARKIMQYHNHIDMNEFTDISLLYDLNQMQILINGEERYYSKKERYRKAPEFQVMNEEGLELKITCDKLTQLTIRSLTITEYEDSCNIIRFREELPAAITKNEAVALGEKPTFEKCISRLPVDIQSEIIQMDEFFKSIRPLKFKRQLEKNGNKITYVASDYGVSYAIYLSNDLFDHSLQWYLITSGKPEIWHRKADDMEETLTRLAKRSPEFAQRMFYNLEDCVGCYGHCLAKTRYHFGDKQKVVCHGKLMFKMSASGFEDVRSFIEEINSFVKEGKEQVGIS